MKKIMSLVLALALVLSMGVTVFAEESDHVETVPGSKDVNVTANYVDPTHSSAGTVYYVVIGWKQTGTITYTGDQYTYTWKPNDGDYGKYEQSGEAAHWTVTDAKVAITVTNKSNAAITATCAEPKKVGNVTVTGSYDATSNGQLELESAAPAESELPTTLNGTERTATATYTITGVDGTITGAGAIATINVSISAK